MNHPTLQQSENQRDFPSHKKPSLKQFLDFKLIGFVRFETNWSIWQKQNVAICIFACAPFMLVDQVLNAVATLVVLNLF